MSLKRDKLIDPQDSLPPLLLRHCEPGGLRHIPPMGIKNLEYEPIKREKCKICTLELCKKKKKEPY